MFPKWCFRFQILMKFLLPAQQTQDPENCKVPDSKKDTPSIETEIKHLFILLQF